MPGPSEEIVGLSDEWCRDHFDFTDSLLSEHLSEAMTYMRGHCPVTRTDANGGQWVVTRYRDVLAVAQDWRTFSSEQKGSDEGQPPVPIIPEAVDPPLHTVYKRLINAFFTPKVVEQYEEATRALATRLIDEFIEEGECEFMAQFARPFPGLIFFDQVLHAPADRVSELNAMATAVSLPGNPAAADSWRGMMAWIGELIDKRRTEGPRRDVVDAVLAAQIQGRPITREEILGIIQLLILGGLETTAGSLGQFFIRFARQPEIPRQLRQHRELMPQAVEELLRLDSPFVFIVRTVTADTEIAGQPVKAGDKVLISWASANRDEDEFTGSSGFHPLRASNRHLAFGAGPHRCAGSNLARMTLRIALEELVGRLDEIELAHPTEPIEFHNAFNRAPLAVPITFAPGPRVGN